MDVLFFLSMTCLLAFMILAMYDGVYLHLWKYELFNRKESDLEHLTHTIRAVLFPLIVWMLFVNTDIVSFWIGLGLVVCDLVVLGIDAYSEKDSRDFMGGLPRWEYIIHLFANGLHFSCLILMVATKISIEPIGIYYSDAFMTSASFELVQFLSINVLPGAIVLAIAHVLLSFDFGRQLWNTTRLKIKCC